MNADPEPLFFELRPRLLRLAYRMLGSVADAEDVAQDAYAGRVRLAEERARAPAARRGSRVRRLGLNELRSARRVRGTCIGPGLPEPVCEVEEVVAIAGITLPLMVALERLSQLQRAAFLLHD